MAIKRYKPNAYQHNKAVQGLKRAGLYGVIITGDGTNVMASFVGNLEKALACTHMAFNGNPLLKQIAEMVSGPRVELSKGTVVETPSGEVGTILGDMAEDIDEPVKTEE